MQSFPKPPSAKEEKEYLRRCREGDKLARNCLIERNMRLVAYIAKKYNAGDKDMDDLISIGTIGLIKGVDSFDESKGIRLATYVSRCIEKAMQLFDHMGKIFRGSAERTWDKKRDCLDGISEKEAVVTIFVAAASVICLHICNMVVNLPIIVLK